MNDELVASSLKTIVLHWVDRETGSNRPFCGQKGGVLMTHKSKLVTCRSCSKKLLFLERIREACRKNPLIIPMRTVSIEEFKEKYPDAAKPNTRTA